MKGASSLVGRKEAVLLGILVFLVRETLPLFVGGRVTGEVHVRRVVVGHDAGMVINPAGLEHQVHGNVVQTTSRALKERVSVDAKGAPEPREWGAYPILSFREVPVIEVVSMPRPGEPPLGAGESSSVPGTAAIANAIFDATGVRFRQPPFTPEVVREALGIAPPRRPVAIAQPSPERRPVDAPNKRRRWWGVAGALAAGLAGMAASMVGQAEASTTGFALLKEWAGAFTGDFIEETTTDIAIEGVCEKGATPKPDGEAWV